MLGLLTQGSTHCLSTLLSRIRNLPWSSFLLPNTCLSSFISVSISLRLQYAQVGHSYYSIDASEMTATSTCSQSGDDKINLLANLRLHSS